ncbi:aminodeoxychorismate synthase component I [Candidatus Peregrinibacteria bacterium]|nr:aminodeoxychorismate synthase component I [Candidatus Peregrinibacteria bacterium]
MGFLKLASRAEPVGLEVTPELIFARLRGEYSFLLRTGQTGEGAMGQGDRYSFLGYNPAFVVWSQEQVLHLERLRQTSCLAKGPRNEMLQGDSFEALRKLVLDYGFTSKAPVPFFGGFAGLFTYDYGCNFVGVKQTVFDDYKLPEFVFAFYDKVICFDHQEQKVWYLALGDTAMEAERVLDQILLDVQKPAALRGVGSVGELSSNLSKEQYAMKIDQLKKYLQQGDTYQANFSQRFSADSDADSWKIFLKLSKITPAPFASYFEFPDFSVVSCSPELLVRKRGKVVETWPIKGTMPRGKNSGEDERLAARLLNSDKNEAELNMIVDLERNDLGKVCEMGSVKVAAHREIQKYSHVIHTVSKVTGMLRSDSDIFDLIQALFPGGSITGAPKKRTMEIIDQLEDFKRGVYTGSAGYMSLNGDMDFNILIRTLLFKDRKVYFNSGGGIVIGSNAEEEYLESLQKAESLRLALQ